MKDKTIVLFLNYEYPPLGGGAANATKYLLQEYAKRDDLEVHLVTSSVDTFRVEKLPASVAAMPSSPNSQNILLRHSVTPSPARDTNDCPPLEEVSLKVTEEDSIHSHGDEGIASTNTKPNDSNVTIHYLDIGKKGNFHYQSNKDLLTYSWKAYRYSKKLMKQHDFDLIHAFFGIPCGFIAQKLGLPYIVSLRGSDVPFYNPRFEKLDKLLFQRMSRDIWKKSKATIANSQGLRDLALESAPTQDIGVIYNGVDISEFSIGVVSSPTHTGAPSKGKENTAKSLSLAGEGGREADGCGLNILAVGRLIPRKGFDLLIQAAKDLRVTITIVGDGPERETLEQLAKDTAVDVHFTGLIDHDEIVQYYQTHDLFALPSANEGMSNTVLEAMACGLPIITTNTGGTQELVTTNGWVIERTVEALRSAIQEALEKSNTLLQMGQDSRARVEEMNWKKVADQYIEEYKKEI